MRCKCCDKVLSDKELRTKNRFGEYEDMCIKCLKLSFIPVEEEEDEVVLLDDSEEEQDGAFSEVESEDGQDGGQQQRQQQPQRQQQGAAPPPTAQHQQAAGSSLLGKRPAAAADENCGSRGAAAQLLPLAAGPGRAALQRGPGTTFIRNTAHASLGIDRGRYISSGPDGKGGVATAYQSGSAPVRVSEGGAAWGS